MVGVLNGWTHVAAEAAASYAAAKLPAGDLQDAAVLKVARECSFRDPRGAAAWVSEFPSGKLRDKAVEPTIFWGQGQCRAAIADLLDALGNAELTKKHGEFLASVWLSRIPQPRVCGLSVPLCLRKLNSDCSVTLVVRSAPQKASGICGSAVDWPGNCR